MLSSFLQRAALLCLTLNEIYPGALAFNVFFFLRSPYRINGIDSFHRLYASSKPHSHVDDIENIYVISDLHTDKVENLRWLQDRCESKVRSKNKPTPNDALIIAGDISHEFSVLEDTLSIVVNNLNCHVFFVWGNHEAWIGGKEMNLCGVKNSLQKIDMVKQLCNKLGVYTDFKLVGKSNANPVVILPIESWYDATLSLKGCEDLCSSFSSWPWVDFMRCKWPEEKTLKEWCSNDKELDRADLLQRGHVENTGRIPLGLTEWFALRNLDAIQKVRKLYNERRLESDSNNADDPSYFPGLITFSHFLPNNKTLPDWKDPDKEIFLRREWLDHPVPDTSAKFAKVSGSQLIDEQIRSIAPSSGTTELKHLHVFGHSHRPKDFVYNGIRYIHNPLAKPAERNMNMVSNEVDFQLIWNCSRIDDYLELGIPDVNVSYAGGTGEIPGSRIIRFWEERGGGKEMLARNMKRRKQRRSLQVKKLIDDMKRQQ